MDTICLQCGDKGFENAFVYCVKCLNFAVHQYCLPELPETFDEFVRWFCDDCEPKSSRQSPIVKPCSIPSAKRDPAIPNGVQVIDSSCRMAETRQHGCLSSPSQQPCDAKTKPDLIKHAHLACNSSTNIKFKVTREKRSTCSVNATEDERHQSNPSQQTPESQNKLVLAERAQLVNDSSLSKLKFKMKNRVIRTVTEAQDQRQQSSPSQQHSERQTAEHAHLAGDCSALKFKLKRKNKDATPSAAEPKEQKCQCSPSHQASEEHTESAMCTGVLSPPNENMTICSCHENRQNDMKRVKERRLILEEGSELGDEANLVRIADSQTPPANISNVSEHNYLHAQPVIDWNHGNDRKQGKEGRLILEEGGELGEEADLDRIADSQTPAANISNVLKHNDLGAQPVIDWNGGNDMKHRNERRLILEEGGELGEEDDLDRIADSQTPADNSSNVSEHNYLGAQPVIDWNRGNDMKHGKERRLILEEGSELGDEANLVRITDSQTPAANILNVSELNYLRAQPVIDPIWRGSFSICNKDYGLFDGIAAHLSIKTCPKVCEEASLLPALLCFEMLPKTAMWPKSFQKSEPKDDNIALYFFPQDKSRERVFDSLVEVMVDEELAMRAMVKNAELLVFTSTELPLLYWKFEGKYYLWGVFRGKQDSSSHPTNHNIVLRNNIGRGEHTNSANVVATAAKRNFTKTSTWDARSPLSPLSNSSSPGSGSCQSLFHLSSIQS